MNRYKKGWITCSLKLQQIITANRNVLYVLWAYKIIVNKSDLANQVPKDFRTPGSRADWKLLAIEDLVYRYEQCTCTFRYHCSINLHVRVKSVEKTYLEHFM